jgi:solute carrier family 35 protein F5
LAVAGDAVFTHVVPGLEYALGAILVIAGFLVVNMATLKNDRHFRQANDQQSNENEASLTQALHTSSRLASNDGPRGGLYK